MAGVSDNQLQQSYGWPAGIDNLSDEFNLARDDHGHTIALREADNVDLRKGKPSRREGYTAMLSGARMHSLWRRGMWPFALFVANGTLRGYRGGADAFDIQAGLDPRAPVSYALAGERVFWTNGRDRGCVRVDGSAMPWGCPNPAGQPTLEPTDVGGLAAGRYQIAITYALASGEESGTDRAVMIDVTEGGGIALSHIPEPVQANVAAIRVYVSAPNGEVLHHATDVAPGQAATLVGQGRRGKQLDTLLMTPMVAGRFVRLHTGRLFVLGADGTLVWSEALRYGLTRPTTNRMRFGAGRLLEAVGQGTAGAGLYVADAKRTYFLSGPPDKMTPAIVYPHSAVPGTAAAVPGSVFGLKSAEEVIYWMAANGVGVLGLPGGQVLPVREQQAVAPEASSGASLYRARDGMHQVVTALEGRGQARGVAMRDRAVVTVERHDQ